MCHMAPVGFSKGLSQSLTSVMTTSSSSDPHFGSKSFSGPWSLTTRGLPPNPARASTLQIDILFHRVSRARCPQWLGITPYFPWHLCCTRSGGRKVRKGAGSSPQWQGWGGPVGGGSSLSLGVPGGEDQLGPECTRPQGTRAWAWWMRKGVESSSCLRSTRCTCV